MKTSTRILVLVLLSGSAGIFLVVRVVRDAANHADRSDSSTPVVVLGDWTAPASMEEIPIRLDETEAVLAWGGERQARLYFDERLPACFARTLVLDTLKNTEVEWIFTGTRAGVSVRVGAGEVRIAHRFHDSPAFNEMTGGKAVPHPEWVGPSTVLPCKGTLRAVTVRVDSKLGLTVLLNGQPVHQQRWLADLSRHQLRLTSLGGELRGQMLRPTPRPAVVRVKSAKQFQTMVGFGGITSPPAYAMLSEKGKRRWWQLVAEYNLLIHREYPMGTRLGPNMDDWDKASQAVPHYYADNFPNSEVSDFSYLKTLRRLGGQVWFEFWALPGWIGTDVEKYARAVVRYCQVSKERTGHPPEIVGIQNELEQTPDMWQRMTLVLRRALDEAGFTAVRIHMSDAAELAGGCKRAAAFRQSKQVWDAIDYSASHMYDYQNDFTDPDRYDAVIAKWKSLADDKPFLATELCVNHAKYQHDSYRLALSMGQLYHKNLVLADAVAICYCWTLLNVTQPSYGATRALFVPDESRGSLPVASSYQLRVFGAFSRRIHQGMTRVEASSDDPDLQVTAFASPAGKATLVVLNRSCHPAKVQVAWAGAQFSHAEVADPYHENAVLPLTGDDGQILLDPGAILTLTNVELLRAP
jgi:O-glycosyl hydrolase